MSTFATIDAIIADFHQRARVRLSRHRVGSELDVNIDHDRFHLSLELSEAQWLHGALGRVLERAPAVEPHEVGLHLVEVPGPALHTYEDRPAAQHDAHVRSYYEEQERRRRETEPEAIAELPPEEP